MNKNNYICGILFVLIIVVISSVMSGCKTVKTEGKAASGGDESRLVIHYNFEDDEAVKSSGGSKKGGTKTKTLSYFLVKDSSGSNNDGKFYGGSSTSYVDDGKSGKGLSFDGVNDYILVASDGRGKFDNQEYTISAWFKSNADPDDGSQVIWSYDYLSHTKPYYAQHLRLGGSSAVNDEIIFGWNRGSEWESLDVNNALAGEQYVWHHIAATFKSGEQKLYLDGAVIEEDSRADTIKYYNQEVWIGKGNFGGFFNGIIDDVKIWDYALSEEEVRGEAGVVGDLIIIERTITPLGNDDYLVSLDINVDETGGINAFVVSEYYPSEWEFLNASHGGINRTNNLIEWLGSEFTELNVQDTVVSYKVRKTNANNLFDGSWMTTTPEGSGIIKGDVQI